MQLCVLQETYLDLFSSTVFESAEAACTFTHKSNGTDGCVEQP